MPIVSVSLSNEDLHTLNRLQADGGFTNRSELLRQALRTLAQDMHALDELSGDISAVLTIVYQKSGKGIESNFLLHHHTQLIDAMLHSHTINGDCIEVVVVNGRAENIRELVNQLKGNTKIHSVTVAIIGV
ncbi:MAG: CopG family ribbon-helix-helix protein [Promethearchaeota archaeon]